MTSDQTVQHFSREGVTERSPDEFMTVLDYLPGDKAEYTSFVKIQLDGPHTDRVNRRSEKVYFVLEGTLKFEAGDSSYTLQAGDGIFVPPGIVHSMVGDEAEFINIVCPPFDPDDEEILD